MLEVLDSGVGRGEGKERKRVTHKSTFSILLEVLDSRLGIFLTLGIETLKSYQVLLVLKIGASFKFDFRYNSAINCSPHLVYCAGPRLQCLDDPIGGEGGRVEGGKG